jgi:hypothetical protein
MRAYPILMCLSLPARAICARARFRRPRTPRAAGLPFQPWKPSPLPPVSLARPSALPADGDGASRRTLASGARSLWVTNASFSVIRRTTGLRRESARSAAERTARGRPSPPRLGGVRRVDRPAHLGAATVGKDGAHLPGGGVGDLEGTAGERLLPLPAHEQGVGVSRYGHSPPPLSRTRGRPAPNPAPA